MSLNTPQRLLLSLVLPCLAASAAAFDPVNGDFAKADPAHLRVLTWNIEYKFGAGGTTAELAAISRVLNAIEPDVIAFQEIDIDEDAASVKALLEARTGGTWYTFVGVTDGRIRNTVASRYPLSLTRTDTIPPAERRGVTCALVDLPEAIYGSTDLYFMALHQKSAGTVSDEAQRQQSADAIINWIRDIQTPGGNITLPDLTPIIYAGDFNIDYLQNGPIGGYHPADTLVSGDIYDETTFGPDRAPDWDGTPVTDTAPYNHDNGDSLTQPASTSPTSRLDRIYHTDAAIHVVNTFILNTTTMSAAARSAAGVQYGDTERYGDGPDHLPLVADFVPGPNPNPPGLVLLNEFSYDDAGTDNLSFVELINVGGQPVNLEAPLDYRLLRGESMPTTANGYSDVEWYFDLVGVIPPGGHFVLYDNGSESSGVTSAIESALPPLQRMKDSNFTLPNTANSAFALVTRQSPAASTRVDTLVEALMFNNASGSLFFFETDATVPLAIRLEGDQLGGLLTNSDATIARRRGDSTPSSYAHWLIGDTATPGTANASALESSDLFIVK